MSALRSPDDAFAAGYDDGAAHPPLTQAQADLVAAILAPYQDTAAAA